MFRAGNHTEAERHYSKALAFTPNDPALLSNRAICRIKRKFFLGTDHFWSLLITTFWPPLLVTFGYYFWPPILVTTLITTFGHYFDHHFWSLLSNG
jgi:hypothetical protein